MLSQLPARSVLLNLRKMETSHAIKLPILTCFHSSHWCRRRHWGITSTDEQATGGRESASNVNAKPDVRLLVYPDWALQQQLAFAGWKGTLEAYMGGGNAQKTATAR